MSATTGYYAPAGQGWRLCDSLVTLAHELTDVYGDQLTCLGTKGNDEHQAEGTSSDHNPFVRDPREPSIGIVRAIDLGGPDNVLKGIRQHLWELYWQQDNRLYIEGYSKGCSDNLINNRGLPAGTHVDTGDAGHLHISVTRMGSSGYAPAIDDTRSWGFSGHSGSGTGTVEGDDMGTIDDSPENEARVKQWVAEIRLGSGGTGADLSEAVEGAPDPVQVFPWLMADRKVLGDSIGAVAAQNAQILALLAAQQPDPTDHTQAIIDALTALPAQVVAAIKEAL